MAVQRLHDQRVAAGACFVAATFLNIIDTTIVNVALPSISADLNVHLASTNAVVVSYLVVLAVTIPVGGWVGDRFGTKRAYVVSVAVFTLASALCGAAGSVGQLVVFRMLQAVGGGIQTPVAMAMLYRAYTPEARVRAARVLVLPTSIAPALGPLLGGALVDTLGWRWVFLVNVPVGVATIAFGLLFLAPGRQRRPGRFDLAGFVLAGLGLGLLTYAFSDAASSGWTKAPTALSLVAGAALLGALVVVELRRREPLVRLRLLALPHFANANGVAVLTVGAFSGLLFVGPLFLQRALGLSAFQSGLAMFPEAIGLLVGSQVGSRVYPRIGARRLMLIGCLGLCATSLGLASIVGPETDLWAFRAFTLLIGFSMIGIQLPNQAIAFGAVAQDDMGHASSLYNSLRRAGGALGVATLAAVLTGLGEGAAVPVSAYRTAFALAAAIAAAAALLTACGPADASHGAVVVAEAG